MTGRHAAGWFGATGDAMPGWMSAVIALAAPTLVVGVGTYRAAGAYRARHARPVDDDLDRELWTADGVRTPWRPCQSSGRVEDRGASAVEYGLLVAAISVVILGVVFGMGHALASVFSNTSKSIEHCISTDPSPCPDSTAGVAGTGGPGGSTVPPTGGQ